MDEITRDLWLAYVAESHRLKEVAAAQRAFSQKQAAIRTAVLRERDTLNVRIREGEKRIRERVLQEVDIAEKRAQFGGQFEQYVKTRVETESDTNQDMIDWKERVAQLSREAYALQQSIKRAEGYARTWGQWAVEEHRLAEGLYATAN
jgi:hypothetical protein